MEWHKILNLMVEIGLKSHKKTNSAWGDFFEKINVVCLKYIEIFKKKGSPVAVLGDH
jgi:hypothetical protein